MPYFAVTPDATTERAATLASSANYFRVANIGYMYRSLLFAPHSRDEPVRPPVHRHAPTSPVVGGPLLVADDLKRLENIVDAPRGPILFLPPSYSTALSFFSLRWGGLTTPRTVVMILMRSKRKCSNNVHYYTECFLHNCEVKKHEEAETTTERPQRGLSLRMVPASRKACNKSERGLFFF